jgi:hypothetical protein
MEVLVGERERNLKLADARKHLNQGIGAEVVTFVDVDVNGPDTTTECREVKL